ncbi:Uncharacterized protein dnm_077300 [Desulfonema magnum]|uniref:Uncharacterized protein n=1 Tax=Desulfonema magnum TaxID=45655 RepID=A0A975BUP1_9BACT|nr:Uncharacterized protein dnm_077300 [Desulfonema magnum]
MLIQLKALTRIRFQDDKCENSRHAGRLMRQHVQPSRFSDRISVFRQTPESRWVRSQNQSFYFPFKPSD